MKGLIYLGKNNIEVMEIERPKIVGPRDIIVKTVKSSICGTDITTVVNGGETVGVDKGDQFGHEFIATVYEIGKDIDFVKPGDRVFVNHCGRRPLSCGQSALKIGNVTGCFSEYVYVEDAKLDYSIFKISDSLSDDRGVLIEPLSIGVHAVNRVPEINKTSKVLVYGSGSIGLCTVMTLQSRGIKDIIIADIDDYKLSFGKKFKNVLTVNTRKENIVDFVKKHWGTCIDVTNAKTWNVDYVFDCAGAKGIISEFEENAKPSSKCVLVAIPKYILESTPKKLVLRESGIIGSIICNPGDITEAIDILNKSENDLEKIVSHVFPFSKIKEAMELAISGKCLKVVIDFTK